MLLYRDADNQTNWDLFKVKFENAKTLFGKEQISVGTIYKLLNLFDKFDEIENLFLFTTIGYHHRNKNWKKDILCNHENPKLIRKVHELLIESTPSDNKTNEYDTFLKSKIVEEIIKKDGNYKYRCREVENSFAIQKEYSTMEGVFVGERFMKRFGELRDLVNKSIIVIDESNQDFSPYYWGKCISIYYNGHRYNWYGSENLWKLNNLGKYDCLKISDDRNFLESLV